MHFLTFSLVVRVFLINRSDSDCLNLSLSCLLGIISFELLKQNEKNLISCLNFSSLEGTRLSETLASTQLNNFAHSLDDN